MHGDYRIDNTMLDFDDATKVLAVLDWEMSTLGDPISDAALMCVYRHPLFNVIHASRMGVAADAGGRRPRPALFACRRTALDNWDFYMALGYFKVGDHRGGHRVSGRGGGGAADTDKVDKAVGPLIAAGAARLS